MLLLETLSRGHARSTKVSDVGRPRKNPLSEDTTLSFKVRPALLKALDAEAVRLTDALPKGTSPISRTEAIKTILYHWLDFTSKPPRQ
jgi:hypothetical protein